MEDRHKKVLTKICNEAIDIGLNRYNAGLVNKEQLDGFNPLNKLLGTIEEGKPISEWGIVNCQTFGYILNATRTEDEIMADISLQEIIEEAALILNPPHDTDPPH